MFVTKRNGAKEPMQFDKITTRISKIMDEANITDIDPVKITQNLVQRMVSGISTNQIDELACQLIMNKIVNGEQYGILATQLSISNLHKDTDPSFTNVVNALAINKDPLGNVSPLVSDTLVTIVSIFGNEIDKMICHDRDKLIDFFGLSTLKKSYLLKSEGRYIERPQHMFMRVAIGIHGDIDTVDLELIKNTYDKLSLHYYTHATPTLFHAGTPLPQMASCFTENMEVCTTKGVKKINQVSIGDYVVTHTGKTQKVSQVHTNALDERKLFKVSFYKGKDLEVTENHKFWALSDKKDNPQWYRIDQLSTDSYIGIPNKQDTDFDLKILDLAEYNKDFSEYDDYITNIQEESIDVHTIYQHTNFGHQVTVKKSHSNINRIWNLDNDFYFIAGCFLGDGHIMTSKKKGYGYVCGIGFTFNSNDDELIEKIRYTSTKLFGIEPVEHTLKNQNSFQLLINSHYIGYVFEKLFGKNFNNKKLPDFVYSADTEKIHHLLAGLISTDGCVSKQRIVSLTLSNYSLMSQIYHLARNNNIDASFIINGYTPKLATVQPVSIRLPSNYEYMKFVIKTYPDDRLEQCLTYTHKVKNQYHPIEIKGNKFVKIKSITEIEPESQLVYTIGVDNDHSYNIEGVLCENCFLIGSEDSVEGIYGNITDCAKISKWAGGIGIHIHDIRSEGAYIRKTGGRSEGIMPMLKVYDATARYINQSGKRNGSFAMYIEPWHPDIIKFLHAKRAQGVESERARDLFYALWVPDLFMKRVQKDQVWSLMCPDLCPGLSDVYGDEFEKLYEQYEKDEKYTSQVSARSIWENIITAQIESGVPYMLYKDACNKKSNQQNIGTIKSSNLCVSGDSKVITEQGVYDISSLKDTVVNVWNGFEFSSVKVEQTGENKELHKITFSNHEELLCTPYHKFYIQQDYHTSKPVEVRAEDLEKGMKIIKCKFPIVPDNDCEFENAYTHGLFCADGIKPGEQKITTWLPQDLAEKYVVPYNYSTNSKLRWLEGYLDGDGCVCIEKTDNTQTIQCVSTELSFLKDVKTLLHTLGCNPFIGAARKNRRELLPDGNGGKELYDCKETYRMCISAYDTQNLLQLGFKPKRLVITENEVQRSASRFITVENIDKNITKQDTYCFNEPKRHYGVFNGIITGQCAEIVQYSDDKSPSVCNLASISLKSVLKTPTVDGVIHIVSKPDCFYCKLLKHKLDKYDFNYIDMNINDDIAIMMNEQHGNPEHNTVPKVFMIKDNDVKFIGGFWDTWELIRPQINHNLLAEIAGDLTINLNNVIDKNFYPLEGAKNSNMRDRPIGIGVQGLADVFAIMMVQYDSDYARKINKEIFETIYYGAMKASIELAKIDGPYSTYEGSPLSKGKFQFDLWEIEEDELSGIWDWNNLRKELLQHGARNSLLTALMPTASTAQMLGNVECFEAFTSNLYTRSTLAGDFIMVNKYLTEILGATGKWNEKIKDQLVYYRGSVQEISDIPTDIKNVFKTIWEISQKKYIQMSAERGPFVDQSQSLNIWFAKPTFGSLYKSHMLSWSLGLKTGSYYVRQLPASNAQRLGMKASVEKEIEGPCLSCSA